MQSVIEPMAEFLKVVLMRIRSVSIACTHMEKLSEKTPPCRRERLTPRIILIFCLDFAC